MTRTVADVAEEVFRRHARRWKPGTLTVNRSYLRRQILPALGDLPVADVDRAVVRRWHASLHATPAAANRALPILSTILRQAEIYGARPAGSNPCAGVRHHRTRRRERFLSAAEYRRLGAALAAARPPVAADAIVRLRWAEVDDGALRLRNTKTGPRTVWLNASAQAVLARQPRTGSPWVFPAPCTRAHVDGEQCACRNRHRPLELSLWRSVRRRAGIPDVRLHDLRHTFASHAVLQGVPLPVVARLLGHAHERMTLRYAHVSDRETEAAAERIGAGLAGMLDA